MRTEVSPGRLKSSSLPFRIPKEGAWGIEVDDGSSGSRIKRRGTMARLRGDSWRAEVTFDTGDKSSLDSVVRQVEQLS